MGRDSAITDSHSGNFRKGGLQSGKQLCFQLAIDIAAGIILRYIAAYVGIKQHGIGDPVGIFAEAPYSDIHIQANIRIYNSERNGICRSILIADDFLRIKVIDPLIFPRIASQGKAAANLLKGLFQAFPKAA